MHKRAIEVRGLKIGLFTNKEELISATRYFEDIVPESLLTDYYEIKSIPSTDALDVRVTVIDHKVEEPKVLYNSNELVAIADFASLESDCKDRRYAFFGTQGMFYRFVLSVLEKKKEVYSFHSASLIHPEKKRLMLLLGGPNSGKTPTLLAGVLKGYRVFGTELTHVRMDSQGYTFYRGGVIDNIRPGHILKYFPQIMELLGISFEPDLTDIWRAKLAVDFSRVKYGYDFIENPEVEIILPMIEEGRENIIVDEVKTRGEVGKILFENASEKIGNTSLMYDKFPVAGLDSQDQAVKRLKAMCQLSEELNLISAIRVISTSQRCMDLF